MASPAPSAFGPTAFLRRFAFATMLVLSTYNPSRFSFAHWVSGAFASGTLGPLHAFAGVALLIGWVILVRTTWQAIGALGLGLAIAFFGTLIWLLLESDLLRVSSVSALIWLALICVAFVLAIGMSWGHLQRRASGQVDVDDVDR